MTADDAPAPGVPEWIYPDAPVVVLVDNPDRRDDPTYYHAAVGKVAKLSFTVTFNRHGEDTTERIRLKDLRSKDYGGGWRSWRYQVLEPDSPKVARLERQAARTRSRDQARQAMRGLMEQHDNNRMDDLHLLREAIKALAAHADLVLAQTQVGTDSEE